MAGRELPSFMQGLMQGYSFVDGIKARDEARNFRNEQWQFQKDQAALQNERADKQLGLSEARLAIAEDQAAYQKEMGGLRFDLARDQFEHQKEQAGLQSARADRQLGLSEAAGERAERQLALTEDAQARKNQDEDRQRIITAGLHKLAEGVELEPSELQELADAGVPLRELADPEYITASEALTQAISEGRFTDPQTFELASVVYRDRLNKGVGEPVPEKYGKGTIIAKRFNDIVPGADRDGDGLPDKVAVELAVDYESEDGERKTYTAPMTVGRSTRDDDDEVAQIPIRTWLGDIQGRALLAGATRDEQFRATLEASLLRAGGDPSKLSAGKYGELVQDPSYGLLQAGPDGKVTQIASAPKQAESGDYSDPYEDPRFGLLQRGPNGKVTRVAGLPSGSGSGSGSGDDFEWGTTEYNAGKAALRDMVLRMDADGNFFMPEGADSEFAEMQAIFDNLGRARVPIGEAVHLAYGAVRGPVTMAQAEQEARKIFRQEGNYKPSSDELKARAKQIHDNGKTARERVDSILSGEGQSGALTGQALAPTYRHSSGEVVTRAEIEATAEQYRKTPQEVVEMLGLQPGK